MNTTDNERRIKRISRRLRYLFQLALVILPFIPVTVWLGYNHLPEVIHANLLSGSLPFPLPLNSRLIALLGSLPGTVLVVLALMKLKRLFSLYERGIYFQKENVSLIRTLARLAFLSIIADIFNKSLLDIARTINNPPGERLVSISLSSDHVKLLIVAAIIMVVSMVIDEARRINDELELTV